jgi:hypothetical protein
MADQDHKREQSLRPRNTEYLDQRRCVVERSLAINERLRVFNSSIYYLLILRLYSDN